MGRHGFSPFNQLLPVLCARLRRGRRGPGRQFASYNARQSPPLDTCRLPGLPEWYVCWSWGAFIKLCVKDMYLQKTCFPPFFCAHPSCCVLPPPLLRPSVPPSLRPSLLPSFPPSFPCPHPPRPIRWPDPGLHGPGQDRSGDRHGSRRPRIAALRPTDCPCPPRWEPPVVLVALWERGR